MPSNKFWRFQNAADGTAELLLYGEISDRTWWGDEATPRQFAEELEKLGDAAEITVRINSGGGDVFAGQAIGNMLSRHKARVTARIDGLCASAATVVASHCDRVVAANDGTYMIHPVRVGIFEYADTAKLQQCLDAIRVIRENIVELYAKKTGREKDEVAGWMDATSWWTAREAMEKGFVDELEDGEGESLVENRSGVLFVNSVSTGLPFEEAPDFVQKRLAEQARSFVNKTPAGRPAQNEREEESVEEIRSVDDLRREYPELVGQIEAAAEERAAGEERQRIRDIEEMAAAGSETLAAEAKYTKPMSAGDFAKAAMKQAREKGAAYLDGVRKDAEEGGANGVGQETPAKDDAGDEFLNAIKSLGSQRK